MSTCRRQPSTFARSLRSISGVSTLSLMAPPFAFPETNPAVRKLAHFRHTSLRSGLAGAGAEALARTREQLVQAPGELGEASLEHGPLRVRLGHESLEAAAKLRFHVAEPALQAVDELLALPLEARRDAAQSLLEPLRAGVADVGEALRDHALGLPRVRLDAAVELACQAPGRVLALRLDRVRELLGRGVGVAGGAAGHRSLELLHLPPLHVREAGLDPPRRFGLLALDLLAQRPLATAKTLVELVERAPPLALRALELGARRRRGLLRRA